MILNQIETLKLFGHFPFLTPYCLVATQGHTYLNKPAAKWVK